MRIKLNDPYFSLRKVSYAYHEHNKNFICIKYADYSCNNIILFYIYQWYTVIATQQISRLHQVKHKEYRVWRSTRIIDILRQENYHICDDDFSHINALKQINNTYLGKLCLSLHTSIVNIQCWMDSLKLKILLKN